MYYGGGGRGDFDREAGLENDFDYDNDNDMSFGNEFGDFLGKSERVNYLSE